MKRTKPLRSPHQQLWSTTQLSAFSGEHDSIRPIRAVTEENIFKYPTYLSQRSFVVQVAQVHNHDSVSGKRTMAVFIEDLATKLWRLPSQIESVYHEYVQRAGMPFHELRAIFKKHFEPLVILRDHEIVSKGDHLRTDLRDGDAGSGQMPIAVLWYRAAPKTNHADVLWTVLEEQKTHHDLRVAEHELVRCGLIHKTLYRVDFKM